MGLTKKIDKFEAKTVMLIDVYRVKKSSVVYLTDTNGSKIWLLVTDIPELIKKLTDIYEQGKQDGKA